MGNKRGASEEPVRGLHGGQQRPDQLPDRPADLEAVGAQAGLEREDSAGVGTTDRVSWTRADDDGPVAHPVSRQQTGHDGKGAVVQIDRDYLPSAAAAAAMATVAETRPRSALDKAKHSVLTFGKFIGPGFLVSVAYIDPGNYATDIAAGASYRFRLLFIVLMSNLFAIFLQSLSIKLGTVTGLNLAEACRAFLPPWLNYFLYAMAETAIIATDIAEVIGTAIALNLLIPQLPLVAGCAISIVDVMLILLFYRPNGSMKGLRCFEFFVMLLVLAVVVCFCIQLSLIENTTAGQVFKGYLPNSAITESDGLLQACGILGATVMPHSLYLGSGIVQSRLRDYDAKKGFIPRQSPSAASSLHEEDQKTLYVPSMAAVQHSLKYAYTELALSLFTFALFVNSAILIVAGASLYGNDEALDADIFGIHDLLSKSISPAAGTVFALALLFSGISAGIVCTISGQMVSEGALRWKMKPWLRRLLTRSISITPSIIIAGAAGRHKLNSALNGSQVVLSIVLPFVTAPLIWFTCFNKYMTVQSGNGTTFHPSVGDSLAGLGPAVRPTRKSSKDGDDYHNAEAGESRPPRQPRSPQGPLPPPQSVPVKMANDWWVAVLAVAIWLVIVVMNVANLVLLALGK